MSLRLVGSHQDDEAVSESEIQALVHEHPTLLPIAEVDPIFSGAVPICRELVTAAGQIDNLLVTPSGLPVIVECKLWRNPEGRREVVGQILDYAKELSRWSSSDLQREVKRRLNRDGNPLLEIVRAAQPDVDEMAFNDALTLNLRRGRFLLLIVGDGIREGVEAIAEYLQRHAGLHFSLGLVELPIYALPDGSRLVVPRVLARTTMVTRHVVAVPDGHVVQEANDVHQEVDLERGALQDSQQLFWAEFLTGLKLDDPEQVIPKPARLGYLSFMLPAPSGSCWLTVYRDARRNEVGVFLSSSRNTAGEYAMRVVVDAWEEIRNQLGGTARIVDRDGRLTVIDSRSTGSLDLPEVRKNAFAWLSERVNTFVSVIRPRIRSAVADYQP
ncbi:hypothetical protein [Mesorhizobium sp.]|uniref:hypothetical protein n=1 Tax=Mesorhizobium sp. TaxID=1871066 RepID=UPI000FE52167|nr:hypothetical protein [Mesorhizobium sp.]RWO81034.1 MAG: hypothetical protein EOQ96_25700 [Mesorhizobium sp.]